MWWSRKKHLNQRLERLEGQLEEFFKWQELVRQSIVNDMGKGFDRIYDLISDLKLDAIPQVVPHVEMPHQKGIYDA